MTKNKSLISKKSQKGGASVPRMGAKRKNRGRGGGNSIGMTVLNPGSRDQTCTVPKGIVMRRSQHTVVSSGRKTLYGDNVVTITGSQPFCRVKVWDTYYMALQAYSTSGATTVANLLVSPQSMGGTLAGLANKYNKYFFTKLRFEYIPYNSNGTSGTNGFAFGFNPEGTEEILPSTYASYFSAVSTLAHSMVIPLTGYIGDTRFNTLDVVPSRFSNPWYWSKNDTSANAGLRQTVQGQVYGVLDNEGSTSQMWGSIWCHYTVELVDLCPSQYTVTAELDRFAREHPDELKEFLTDRGRSTAEGSQPSATTKPGVESNETPRINEDVPESKSESLSKGLYELRAQVQNFGRQLAERGTKCSLLADNPTQSSPTLPRPTQKDRSPSMLTLMKIMGDMDECVLSMLEDVEIDSETGMVVVETPH